MHILKILYLYGYNTVLSVAKNTVIASFTQFTQCLPRLRVLLSGEGVPNDFLLNLNIHSAVTFVSHLPGNDRVNLRREIAHA